MILSKAKTSIRTCVNIGVSAAVIAACSQISIPSVVPFTMQTFAVFCALATLGGKGGTISVLIYIVLGAVGVPVFAGFTGGVGVLFGTTGGYIIGFLFTGLIYWLITHFLGEKLPVMFLALVLGLAVCYAFGTAWFMIVYAKNSGSVGLMTALGWCVFPFILPDCVKMALAILIGGLFLIWKKVISPIIPVTFIATVFVLGLIWGGFDGALFHILAGGLMLGAFFCATDYVTSPTLPLGKVIFGIGCGLFTMLIRIFASYPEGVSFAILLMNILTPYIDKICEKRMYKLPKKAKEGEK